jgi:acetyl esterase/lipase
MTTAATSEMAAFERDTDVFHRWSDEQSDAARSRIRHELDVPYGTHPRKILDIYYPRGTVTDAAVLVFIHGGGFRQGFPGRFGYVAEGLTEHGAVVVVAGYRLIPDGVFFPDSSVDIEEALAWVYVNIEVRGGDPNRIYLAGHSAGAILSADVALRPELTRHGVPADLIKGLVALSGGYVAEQLPRGMVNPGSKRFLANLRETIPHLPPHIIAAAGTCEQLPFTRPEARALTLAINARGGSAELIELEGCDHLHTLDSLAWANGEVFKAVKTMMRL